MMVAKAPVALDPLVAREKIRANDLAGARRQHAARREPDGGRAKRVREAGRGRAARAGTASASARIARFTNIVASDSASHSGRARTISRDHAAQSRRCAGTARAAPTASASTTIVRRCDRMRLKRLYYTALAASRGPTLYVVVVSAARYPVRCDVFPARGILLPLAAPILQTTLGPPRPGSTGQGPRHLRFRRPAADRRHRSDLGVRLRARVGHPRQGQGAHPDLGVLVRAHARDRRQPPALDRSRRRFPARRARRRDAAARPLDAGARTEPLPIECVARGYLSGSGWKDYQATGEVCGIRLPRACASRIGCRSRSSRRPPRRRAATTSTSAKRDAGRSGRRSACCERVRDLTLRLYAEGAAHAESCGIIVADTKFEFGLLPERRPVRSRTA